MKPAPSHGREFLIKIKMSMSAAPAESLINFVVVLNVHILATAVTIAFENPVLPLPSVIVGKSAFANLFTMVIKVQGKNSFVI
ncbi:hypothetical protein MXB_343 [Myxobolus squamalis]|nr:hypothetical protein MXB_343 [Myxobolus squamalis]